MRLCRFHAGEGASVGLVQKGAVYDLRELGPSLLSDPAAALAAGAEHLTEIAACAPARALEDITLLAPAQPKKFLGIGLNYADHIAESGMDAPDFPVFFNKQVTCIEEPEGFVAEPTDAATACALSVLF